jgi:hypothetical protein
MNTIPTKDGTHIFYTDLGAGLSVVFSHGWPLSADAAEDQMFFSPRAATTASPMTVAVTGVPADLGTATTWTLMRTIWPNSSRRCSIDVASYFRAS